MEKSLENRFLEELNKPHDDIDYETEKAECLEKMMGVLSKLEKFGDFATGSSFDVPEPPNFEVKGKGKFPLPLTPDKAKELISHCTLAPFGKGAETITDTTVRNTWQIDPDKVKFSNPAFKKALTAITNELKIRLGLGKTKISTSLYKALLYEPGSFFKPHRDTEKEKGMFGTLVVQLPSVYEGGEIQVQHNGECKSFDFSNSENFHYLAFYADCEHEVKPLTQGYRLCLVYNLLYPSDTGLLPPVVNNSQSIRQLKDHLLELEQSSVVSKGVYVLDHVYTQESLSFKTLKKNDAEFLELLRQLKESVELDYCLAIVSRHEEDMESHDEFKWPKGYLTNEALIQMKGEYLLPVEPLPFPLTTLPIYPNEIVQGDSKAQKDLTRSWVCPTGNEGTEMERCDTLEATKQLTLEVNACEEKESEKWAEIRRKAKAIIEETKNEKDSLRELMCVLGDLELWQLYFTKFPPRWESEMHQKALQQFPWDQFFSILVLSAKVHGFLEVVSHLDTIEANGEDEKSKKEICKLFLEKALSSFKEGKWERVWSNNHFKDEGILLLRLLPKYSLDHLMDEVFEKWKEGFDMDELTEIVTKNIMGRESTKEIVKSPSFHSFLYYLIGELEAFVRNPLAGVMRKIAKGIKCNSTTCRFCPKMKEFLLDKNTMIYHFHGMYMPDHSHLVTDLPRYSKELNCDFNFKTKTTTCRKSAEELNKKLPEAQRRLLKLKELLPEDSEPPTKKQRIDVVIIDQ